VERDPIQWSHNRPVLCSTVRHDTCSRVWLRDLSLSEQPSVRIIERERAPPFTNTQRMTHPHGMTVRPSDRVLCPHRSHAPPVQTFIGADGSDRWHWCDNIEGERCNHPPSEPLEAPVGGSLTTRPWWPLAGGCWWCRRDEGWGTPCLSHPVSCDTVSAPLRLRRSLLSPPTHHQVPSRLVPTSSPAVLRGRWPVASPSRLRPPAGGCGAWRRHTTPATRSSRAPLRLCRWPLAGRARAVRERAHAAGRPPAGAARNAVRSHFGSRLIGLYCPYSVPGCGLVDLRTVACSSASRS